MSWVAGLRSNTLYTCKKRPLDPRWSEKDIQTMLAWCANGQAQGWTEDRAFQVAEAVVMKSKNHGIVWSQEQLVTDMGILLGVTRE